MSVWMRCGNERGGFKVKRMGSYDKACGCIVEDASIIAELDDAPCYV